jgi:hypothetical protein
LGSYWWRVAFHCLSSLASFGLGFKLQMVKQTRPQPGIKA